MEFYLGVIIVVLPAFVKCAALTAMNGVGCCGSVFVLNTSFGCSHHAYSEEVPCPPVTLLRQRFMPAIVRPVNWRTHARAAYDAGSAGKQRTRWAPAPART